MDVIYGFNLTFLEEYDRVNNLRNNTKLDAAYQALKRVDPACRMYDAYHTHPCEAHVGERPEVAGLTELVIDRIVWSHKQQNVGRLGHVAFERGVLRDVVRNL